MEFTLYKDELLQSLLLLEPYIGKPQKMEGNEEDEDDGQEEIIRLQKPYFDDKVTFSFDLNRCYLSVCTNGVHVGLNFRCSWKIGNFSFCIPLRYLRQRLSFCDGEIIKFEEERFFGFSAYAVELHPERFLFDVPAYSVKKQQEYRIFNPAILYASKSWLVPLLQEMGKYTGDFCLRPFLSYVWFNISDGRCTALASDGHTFSLKTVHVDVSGNYEFCILGREITKIIETLAHFEDSLEMYLAYEHVRILGTVSSISARMYITHHVPQDIEKYNVDKIVENKSVSHKADMRKEHLLRIAGRISAIEYGTAQMILHFINNHVNVHSAKSIFDPYVSEFYEVTNCNDDFVIAINAKQLLLALKDISSEYACIRIYGNYIYVLNEEETVGGNSFRLIMKWQMDDDDFKWMESRDYEMAKLIEGYRGKYLRE